ncbi:MAG: hypothetical protein EPN36_15305 [Rhodanobacteraceae bacterium]|nr:MAG: hypothetical protein EPN36_15305 [Rhodanobacteraceae bacterium]
MRYFEGKSLSSGCLNYASTAIASAIELVDTRFSEAWRSEYPAMRRWFDAISENASLRATKPLKIAK